MFDLMIENSNANIVDLNDGEHYEVLTASGLTPPSASIFTAKSPNKKGSKYNGSTLHERVIVLQIKLLGNVEENRNALYSWVDTEQYAKIYYRNGAKNVFCEGHIEVCEADLFSNNEVMQVEILCENPYWKDLQEISVDISNVLKHFTFPFAIAQNAVVEVEVTNQDGSDAIFQFNEGIPFSTLKENNITDVFNLGAETGAIFIIYCPTAINSLLIYDADDTTKRFSINYEFLAGWQIVIDTESSPKTCKAIKPDGTVLNLLKYVSGKPTWFTLKKGNNRMAYLADDGAASVEMSVSFTKKYLGV